MTTPAPTSTGQVEPSRRAAEAVARAAGVAVVELASVEETAAATAVFGAIWGVASSSAMPAELVRALARGIERAEWTYDPLVRRNTYFNLTKLGATAVAYHADFYGGMDDAINAGHPTDRCVALWDLAAPRAVAAAAGTAAGPDLAKLLAAGARVLLAEGENGEPLVSPGRVAPVQLCQVPADVVRLRATRPALASAWRLAVRETLGQALDGGWVATGATRSGWCVLERGEGPP